MTASIDPLSADTIDRLRQASTATLASQLFKHGFKNVFLRGLRPLCPSLHMAGLLDRVKGGAPLPGTYPPNEATRAEYEASRRATSQQP